MQNHGYDASVIPDPISFDSAVMKPVPLTLARDVFHAIKMTQNLLHRAPAAEQSVVPLEKTTLDGTVPEICDWIQKHTHENEDVVIKIEFPGAHRHYGIVLICLLTYRARWPCVSLPTVWIIDTDMPPLPANYSKAFAWRYQTRRAGSMSGKLLEFGIENLKTLYSEHKTHT